MKNSKQGLDYYDNFKKQYGENAVFREWVNGVSNSPLDDVLSPNELEYIASNAFEHFKPNNESTNTAVLDSVLELAVIAGAEMVENSNMRPKPTVEEYLERIVVDKGELLADMLEDGEHILCVWSDLIWFVSRIEAEQLPF